ATERLERMLIGERSRHKLKSESRADLVTRMELEGEYKGIRGVDAGKIQVIKAKALAKAAVLALMRVDYAAALSLLNESLSLQRDLGDKKGIANSLNNLGVMASEQGDYAAARSFLEEGLLLRRELGDK